MQCSHKMCFFRDKGCGCVIKLGCVCFYMLMIPSLAGNKFIPIFEEMWGIIVRNGSRRVERKCCVAALDCVSHKTCCTDLNLKHLTFLRGFLLLNICTFMRKIGAACFEKFLLWDSAVYIISASPQESCKHHNAFLFVRPGLWKLYKVCQLPGWTVLRGSMSPRRARGGRHAGVEIRRWHESVPAMPQKLHSRVKALFGQPESRRCVFPVLQTFVFWNADSVI